MRFRTIKAHVSQAPAIEGGRNVLETLIRQEVMSPLDVRDRISKV